MCDNDIVPVGGGSWIAAGILAIVGAVSTAHWVPGEYERRHNPRDRRWYQWSPLVLCIPFLLRLIWTAVL